MKRTSYLQGWKLYPKEFVGHHIQGICVGILVFLGIPGIAIGVIWTLLYTAYQALSLIRKGDSAGLDIADFLMGFWIGVLIGWATNHV